MSSVTEANIPALGKQGEKLFGPVRSIRVGRLLTSTCFPGTAVQAQSLPPIDSSLLHAQHIYVVLATWRHP